jgi:hypothetical protein
MSADLRTLDDRETNLLWTLRDLPHSRLRADLLAILDEFLALAQGPCCTEMQADGAPCPSAHTACDQCQRVLARLERIRAALHAARAA